MKKSTQHRNKKRLIIVSRFLFLIYMLDMIYFLFFSENMGRSIGLEYRYNLEPLQEIKRFIQLMNGEWKWYAIFNLIGNVVCFIPFGALLPVIIPSCRTMIRTVILTMMFTFLIESVQLVFKIGIFDVDDIILNTLGGILGYGCYKVAMKIWKGVTVK